MNVVGSQGVGGKLAGRFPKEEEHQTLQLKECWQQRGEHGNEQSVFQVNCTGSGRTLRAAGTPGRDKGTKAEIRILSPEPVLCPLSPAPFPYLPPPPPLCERGRV